MASMILRLDSRTTKNGMQQIRMRISHAGTNSWLPTGVWVEPECFSTESVYDPISRKAVMAQAKNTKIAELVTKYNKVVMDMEEDDSCAFARMCANDIRDACVGVRVKVQRACTKRVVQTADYMQLFDRYAQSRTNENSRRHYEYAWRVLCEYMRDNKLTRILVSDVNYALLSDVKRWLRASGRGEVTRYKIESYMRAVYKEAERCRLISRDVSPYFDYKIDKVPEKDIEVLDVEVLRKMLSMDLRKYYGMDRARDMLMASFYMCGANLIDLFGMPKCKDEVVFIRHKIEGKTQRYLHIKIEDELQCIISKWAGVDRMFDIFDRSNNYYTAQRRLNRQMSDLSAKLGTKVNMELIRRTWCSIAGYLDVPDRVAKKSMGHKDKGTKDIYYEKYDWSRTAKYNRQIIDYIWKGVVPNSVSV